MWLATAQAKALGLAGASSSIDGYAGFSDVYPFAYDPNNRAVSGEYDFIGVVEHEFTEDMGRIDLFGDNIGGTPNSYSLLDLYHYTSPGVHTYTGATANYFSVDGGKTNLDLLQFRFRRRSWRLGVKCRRRLVSGLQPLR